MTVLIDRPLWWWRGRRWCHMVSDTDITELHALAENLGIPRRAFQGDHYDVPEELWEEAIARGAALVDSRELMRRLRSGGLRVGPGERRRRAAAPSP